MKLVTAIVQPEKLEDVQRALVHHGVSGITISEVSGYGRQRGHVEVYRGAEFTIDFILKVKIEVLADEPDVDELVDVIARACRTGNVGDGKIWVVPVESVTRVRTGERDHAAI
ncbi:MAG TPA: P-II family nitrogen regulator [Propionibacteriaceae bacterium]|nr:P-II family nitrogen regulator [Propionibacteriaceae bacterium]